MKDDVSMVLQKLEGLFHKTNCTSYDIANTFILCIHQTASLEWFEGANSAK